jgi:FkbM family methyltransferase
MEFWRNSIREGMTVIDVGANAGVYTFSAAHRVGKTGKVIAIEPFSQCIQLLEETCRVNQFSWVYPCRRSGQ